MIEFDYYYHLKKEKTDQCNIKILTYDFELLETDTIKFIVYDATGNTIKEYLPYAIETYSAFFLLDDTIDVGNYFFDIYIERDTEKVKIFYNRRYDVYA